MTLLLEQVRLPLAPFTLAIDASFAAPMTGVFGPSGAGKTSLLEAVAGLRRIASGRIVLDGVVLADPATGVCLPPGRRGLGYVPQEGALFPHLSPRENLLYGRRGREDAAGGFAFDDVVAALEIADLLDRPVKALSGGERQRVALGRALLSRPRLLLLDEPLAGLDRPLKQRLLPLLRHAREKFGVPTIYVTHAADEVMELCQTVLVLHRGEVADQGTPEEIFRESAKPHYELRRPLG